MAEGCPKRLIVLGLEWGGGSVLGFWVVLFQKWLVKPLGVLTRTLVVHVFPQLGVPGRVIIVCVMQHHMTSRCMVLSPHLVGEEVDYFCEGNRVGKEKVG